MKKLILTVCWLEWFRIRQRVGMLIFLVVGLALITNTCTSNVDITDIKIHIEVGFRRGKKFVPEAKWGCHDDSHVGGKHHAPEKLCDPILADL